MIIQDPDQKTTRVHECEQLYVSVEIERGSLFVSTLDITVTVYYFAVIYYEVMHCIYAITIVTFGLSFGSTFSSR